MANPVSARMVETKARANAPSSSDVFDMCIEKKRISNPPVVPMNPIGGRMFEYIEIRRA